MTMRSRAGFVLIFVLWMLVSGSALAVALAGITRTELAAIRNRTESVRAGWQAKGCLDHFRSDAEALVWSDDYTSASVSAAWDALDRLPVSSTTCVLNIRPAGLAANVNALGARQLRDLFIRLGAAASRADSLSAALSGWRDTDDVISSAGAETAWYRERRLIPPRNGPFKDVAELALVRGMDSSLLARGLLDVAPERILWRRADPAILGMLPGMTDEALAVLAAHDRSQITTLANLVDFPELSAAARDSLARASQALLPMITSSVESWVVTATARVEHSAIHAAAIERLGLRDDRLLVLERRLLP
jgi:type II secretory pathway component PulK